MAGWQRQRHSRRLSGLLYAVAPRHPINDVRSALQVYAFNINLTELIGSVGPGAHGTVVYNTGLYAYGTEIGGPRGRTAAVLLQASTIPVGW